MLPRYCATVCVLLFLTDRHRLSALSTVDILQQNQFMSASFVARQNKRCEPAKLCADAELDVAPICGTDGRTYNSLCEVRRAVCHGNPVERLQAGPCPEKSKCSLEHAFQRQLMRVHNQSAVFIPECEEDGSYSTVQCHGSTGYCWCVTQTGRPIPGSSVRFKRPNCAPQGKVGRRSSRRRLGRPRRVCSAMDRSTFNANLLKIFRSEFERSGAARRSKPSGRVGRLVVSLERRVIGWKFAQLDANTDGRLSARELRAPRRLIRRLVQPRPCARQFTRRCDHDADRKIDRREWFFCLGVDVQMSFAAFSSLADSRRLSNTSARRRPPPLAAPVQLEEAVPGNLHTAPSRHSSRSSMLVRAAQPTTTAASGDDAEADDCAAHRRRALRDKPDDARSYVPVCQNGTRRLYAAVQCHSATQYCWCADARSGRPVPGTSVQHATPDCAARPALRGGEIKRCKADKRQRFYQRLYAKMQTSMIAAGGGHLSESMSRKEMAVRWKFDQLDANKNRRLERREWRPYRLELKHEAGVKRCGRNFLRYCDADGDKTITLDEWLQCTVKTVITRIPPHSRAKSLNPFESILQS